MVKASHKPPSRIKYEQSHPVVSCRLDMDTYTQLHAFLENTGVSFADFVKLELKLESLSSVNSDSKFTT